MPFEYQLKGRIDLIDNLMVLVESAGARAWEFVPEGDFRDNGGVELRMYSLRSLGEEGGFATVAIRIEDADIVIECFKRMFAYGTALAAGASLTLKLYEVLDAIMKAMSNGAPNPDAFNEAARLLEQCRGAFVNPSKQGN